jgi:uncharacterized protein
MPGKVNLLDGNVLIALIDQAHVHHTAARGWFVSMPGHFATCPITQGTLVRLVMRLNGHSVEEALELLALLTANKKHHFWPDRLAYGELRWHGVMGHRQVTDAYLAGLARHHGGKLITFDKGLVALHPDVAMAIDV